MTRNAWIIPAFSLRDWVAPRYKPEKHYMRGPGPACDGGQYPVGPFPPHASKTETKGSSSRDAGVDANTARAASTGHVRRRI